MATSSIKKDFTVKNIEKYKQIINKVNEQSTGKTKITPSAKLERGKELLKQFSFR